MQRRNHIPLDHDEFGSLRSKLMNVIDSNMLARDSREKPASTFSHPALWAILCATMSISPALAAPDCEFADPGKAFSVAGNVLSIGAANDIVVEMGYRKVVAIQDKKRGCVAYVQTRRATGCAKGKTATAKGKTFVIAFTPMVLTGADSVTCR